MSNRKYEAGSVVSKGGTVIGYRQMGDGPGVILFHGGADASQSYSKLDAALSDAFTVYIPDRRGGGLSGPFGDNYSMPEKLKTWIRF